jgi:uncharacterized protein DUF6228
LEVVAAQGSIRIISTEPGVQLELIWQDERTVHVTIRDEGLVAESDVWWNDYMDEPAALATFFEDLAANWRGWSGSKVWRAAESPFQLSGAHDGLGHVYLDVELRSGWYEDDWRACTRIVLEAGALDDTVSKLRAFLLPSSRPPRSPTGNGTS